MEHAEIPELVHVERELMGRSLASYIRGPDPEEDGNGECGAWRQREGAGRGLVWGFHMDAIAEHLEAAIRGEVKRLLINIPPRMSKSSLACVYAPTWAWGPLGRPGLRWIFSSYAEKLAIRDTVHARRLIQTPWYQRRWGDRFQLAGDQNAKSRYDNDHGGFRFAASVGGSVTGEGGDYIVCDDPHNVLEALHPGQLEEAINWWDEVMASRLDDPKRGVRIVIMQRVHESDLSGHVLSGQHGYTHLNLPMEYEGKCVVEVPHSCSQQGGTDLGFTDPREEPGELLCPERYDAEGLATLKAEMRNDYVRAAQLQQRPSPRGGGMFRVDRFRVVDARPCAVVARVRYWDKASGDNPGDAASARSAGVRMELLEDGRWIITDVEVGSWSPLDRETRILTTAKDDGEDVTIWIEQEPGSGGKESAQATVRRLHGYVCRIDRASVDKVTRARNYAAQVEAGNVLMIKAPWNRDLRREHEVFPVGRIDIADACAGAWNKLDEQGGAAWAT